MRLSRKSDGEMFGITSDFVFFAVFIVKAPYIALRHAIYFRQVVECWKSVFAFRALLGISSFECVGHYESKYSRGRE